MNSKNKKYLNTGLFFIGLVLIAVLFRKEPVSGDFSYHLKMQSIQANKEAPFMVDENLRFDRADSLGKTMTYTYTMINAVKEDGDLALFKLETEAHLKKTACLNEGIAKDLERGAFLNYLFLDKNGETLLSTDLTKEICNLK